MANLQIQPVDFQHLETLRDLAELTFRRAFEHNNDPVDFEDYCQKAFTLAQVEAEWRAPNTRFWLAHHDGQLAAYLKINFERPAEGLAAEHPAQLERLYVSPDQQGKNIGAQLLQFARQQCATEGVDWIWLTVWQENPPAVRFYERHDYTIFSTKTFLLGADAQTDWLMKCRVI